MRQQKSRPAAWAGSVEAANNNKNADELEVKAEASQPKNWSESVPHSLPESEPELPPEPQPEVNTPEWSKASLEQIRSAMSKFASDRDWGEPKHHFLSLCCPNSSLWSSNRAA